MGRRTDINNVQVTDFVVRGLYTVQNGRAKNPVYTIDENDWNGVKKIQLRVIDLRLSETYMASAQ